MVKMSTKELNMKLEQVEGIFQYSTDILGFEDKTRVEYTGAYALVCKTSNKAYLGWTDNGLYFRIAQHLSAVRNRTHESKELIADIERGLAFKVLTFPGMTEQELFDSWKNETYNKLKRAGTGSVDKKDPIEKWLVYRGWLPVNRTKSKKRYEVKFGNTSFCIYSLSEFSTITGLKYSKLYEVVKGQRKSYKGFELKEV